MRKAQIPIPITIEDKWKAELRSMLNDKDNGLTDTDKRRITTVSKFLSDNTLTSSPNDFKMAVNDVMKGSP